MTLTSNAQTIKLGDIDHDGIVSVADVTALVDIILNGYSPFSVSQEEVTMQVGETADVTISGGYDIYEVEAANPNIVTATLDGSTVTFTAVSGGETTVTVKDVLTFRTIDIEVTVEVNQPQPYRKCPDENHPHIIDLGLPSGTLWACCNVGAVKPEAYGGYYAWGETEEKSHYDWSTDTYNDESEVIFYNLDSDFDIAGSQYDVAHIEWGGSWVMPSFDQINELVNNCSYTWATINGINGGKFTSNTNGGTIFLPAAGCCTEEGSLGLFESDGFYWSSTSSTRYPSTQVAYNLGFNSKRVRWFNDFVHRFGFTVRPVICVSPVVNLKLSKDVLHLAVGVVDFEKITIGSGYYSIESSDESVATASLQGNSIIITAVEVGTATITVTDMERGLTATIEVMVTSLCPDNNHPHLIDLGLPSGTKWACCNVGADKPEAYGGNYSYWNTNLDFDSVLDIAGSQYDVAHMEWGGTWVMPSKEQQDELKSYCTYGWVTVNGVFCGKFTSRFNGGTIYLPAPFNSFYMSSTLDWGSNYILGFDSSGAYGDYLDVYNDYLVRPVSR